MPIKQLATIAVSPTNQLLFACYLARVPFYRAEQEKVYNIGHILYLINKFIFINE